MDWLSTYRVESFPSAFLGLFGSESGSSFVGPSVVCSGEDGGQKNLSVFRSVYVPMLTHGHDVG